MIENYIFKVTEIVEVTQEEKVQHLAKDEKVFGCHVVNGEGEVMWTNITVAGNLDEAQEDFQNTFFSELEFDVSEVV